MNKSLDGLQRKRIYLFRHGDVSYFGSGKVTDDPNMVDLTELGREQAKMIDENTKDINFDRILCSGLPRTEQTGFHMAKRRNLSMEAYPQLKEFQWDPKLGREFDIKKLGFLFESESNEEEIGGLEGAQEFYDRVSSCLESIIKEEWSKIAIVLHGAVNAALLCWANDLEIRFASKFEQDHASMNILDIDINSDDSIKRKIIRRLNVPPDLSNIDADIATSWEKTANQIMKLRNT